MKIFLALLVLVLSMPSVVFAGSVFPDVYNTEPVNTALEYLVDEGVVEGYGDGTFQPLNLINRAEFTKMVVEGVLGVTPDETVYRKCFSDVQDEWYAKYVCYAWELGWVEGYDSGLFKPGDNITKTEALKIISVAFDWELENPYEYSQFYDVEYGSWYEPYVLTAEERGLLDSVDYYFSPHELISRKQMSELLYRAMKYEAGESFLIWELYYGSVLGYEDVLDMGLVAAYPGEMEFTAQTQAGWPYACYGFAVSNLLNWKYGFDVGMSELADSIGWDGHFIWDSTEFDTFADVYNMDIIFTYYGSAEFLLTKLAMGEPLIMYIPYYQNGVNIGHQVVAYSFDENGVWIADSDGGIRWQVGFDQVFLDGENYTTNLTDYRQVKAGGTQYSQSGL